jgi:integrase
LVDGRGIEPLITLHIAVASIFQDVSECVFLFYLLSFPHIGTISVVTTTYQGVSIVSIPQGYPREVPAPMRLKKKRGKRASFTDQYLKGLKPASPAERRYEVFDDGTSREKYPGFGIRVTFRGIKSFFVLLRRDGKLRRFTIGEYGAVSLKEARQAALRLRRNPTLDPVEKKKVQREAPMFAELVEEFLERYVVNDVRPATAEVYRRILSKKREDGLLNTFGNRKAIAIATRDVEDWRDEHRDTPVGTNRALEVLSRIFSWAKADRELRETITTNPCAGVTALPENPKNRALKEDELAAVLKAANELEPKWRDAVWWMAMHGCRPADVYLRAQGRGMSWMDVDIKGREWQLPITKTEPRAVPLTDYAIEALERIHTYNDSDLVFPSLRWDEVARAIREKVGFDFQPKDLRTTVATQMQKLGILPDIIDLIEGRVPPAMRGVRKRYQQYDYWEQRTEALERWHRKLFSLMEEETEDAQQKDDSTRVARSARKARTRNPAKTRKPRRKP